MSNFIRPVGYIIKTPSTYNPTIETLENSNRNANGDLIREIIADKIKIELTWNTMTQDELAVLQYLRRLKSFDVEYLDLDGTYKTIEVYIGNSFKATPLKTENGYVTVWKDVQANLIEF